MFLVPMWKEALDFDMRAENRHTPVKEIIEGKAFHRPLGGFAGVANVGLDDELAGPPDGDGESLWFRAACVESGYVSAGNC